MTKLLYRFKTINWRSVISSALVIVLLVSCTAGLATMVGKDTKTISPTVFKVGGLDERGMYVNTNTSIYTPDLIECQGLSIEPDFEAKGEYQVFYYDHNKLFMGSTGAIFAEDGVYPLDIDTQFSFASYCRIMITPDVPVDENGKQEKEFKIRFWEVLNYAKDYTITVNKKQTKNELYEGANLLRINTVQSATFTSGINGFKTVDGTGTFVSNLMDIKNCNNICIKINSNKVNDVTFYALNSDDVHSTVILGNAGWESTFIGEYVYLTCDINDLYEGAEAIALVSTSFNMAGTEVYIW